MFPNINTKGTNYEVKESIHAHLEKRLHPLAKFLPKNETDLICDVELEKLQEHQSGRIYRAEINLKVGGRLFRAEATEERMENAIDRAKNEMKKELRRREGKDKSLLRRGGQRLKDLMRFGE